MDQEITESHLPGQYLDIALVPGQYLDIALAAGQYKIYCPALAFDPPTQSVTYQANHCYATLNHAWPNISSRLQCHIVAS